MKKVTQEKLNSIFEHIARNSVRDIKEIKQQFKNMDLSGLDFRGVEAWGTSFDNSILDGANFEGGAVKVKIHVRRVEEFEIDIDKLKKACPYGIYENGHIIKDLEIFLTEHEFSENTVLVPAISKFSKTTKQEFEPGHPIYLVDFIKTEIDYKEIR